MILKIEINKFFLPIIAKKIIAQFTFSNNYGFPTQKFSQTTSFNIDSINPEKPNKIHELDLSNNYCTCLKQIYDGIPCRHLFRLWKYVGHDLIEKIFGTINEHWKLIKIPKLNSIKITITPALIGPIQKQHNQTGIATVSVSPNKSTPTELNDLNFKSQNKLKHCNKASKKKKTTYFKFTLHKPAKKKE